MNIVEKPLQELTTEWPWWPESTSDRVQAENTLRLRSKLQASGASSHSRSLGSSTGTPSASASLLWNAREISTKVNEGDELSVDLERGEIRNLTTGATAGVQPIPGNLLQVLEDGGIIEHLKRKRGYQ